MYRAVGLGMMVLQSLVFAGGCFGLGVAIYSVRGQYVLRLCSRIASEGVHEFRCGCRCA
jgi:hypothetical protein